MADNKYDRLLIELNQDKQELENIINLASKRRPEYHTAGENALKLPLMSQVADDSDLARIENDAKKAQVLSHQVSGTIYGGKGFEGQTLDETHVYGLALTAHIDNMKAGASYANDLGTQLNDANAGTGNEYLKRRDALNGQITAAEEARKLLQQAGGAPNQKTYEDYMRKKTQEFIDTDTSGSHTPQMKLERASAEITAAQNFVDSLDSGDTRMKGAKLRVKMLKKSFKDPHSNLGESTSWGGATQAINNLNDVSISSGAQATSTEFLQHTMAAYYDIIRDTSDTEVQKLLAGRIKLMENAIRNAGRSSGQLGMKYAKIFQDKFVVAGQDPTEIGTDKYHAQETKKYRMALDEHRLLTSGGKSDVTGIDYKDIVGNPALRGAIEGALKEQIQSMLINLRASSSEYLDQQKLHFGTMFDTKGNLGSMQGDLANMGKKQQEIRNKYIEASQNYKDATPGSAEHEISGFNMNLYRRQLTDMKAVEAEAKHTFAYEMSRGITNRAPHELNQGNKPMDRLQNYGERFGIASSAVAKDFEERFGAIKRHMAGISNYAFMAAGGMLAMVGHATKLAAEFQKTRIVFAALLQDQGKANMLISEIMQYSLRTPYQFQDITAMASTLLASGYKSDELMSTLKPIIDSVTAVGGDKALLDRVIYDFGKMKSTERIDAREMRTLAYARIPGWQMLGEFYKDKDGNRPYFNEETGTVNTHKLMKDVSKGKIRAEGREAILEGMTARYGGVAEERMNSTAGRLENFQERMTFAAVKIASAFLPLADTILEAGKNLLNFLSTPGMREMLQALAKMVIYGGLIVGVLGRIAVGVIVMQQFNKVMLITNLLANGAGLSFTQAADGVWKFNFAAAAGSTAVTRFGAALKWASMNMGWIALIGILLVGAITIYNAYIAKTKDASKTFADTQTSAQDLAMSYNKVADNLATCLRNFEKYSKSANDNTEANNIYQTSLENLAMAISMSSDKYKDYNALLAMNKEELKAVATEEARLQRIKAGKLDADATQAGAFSALAGIVSVTKGTDTANIKSNIAKDVIAQDSYYSDTGAWGAIVGAMQVPLLFPVGAILGYKGAQAVKGQLKRVNAFKEVGFSHEEAVGRATALKQAMDETEKIENTEKRTEKQAEIIQAVYTDMLIKIKENPRYDPKKYNELFQESQNLLVARNTVNDAKLKKSASINPLIDIGAPSLEEGVYGLGYDEANRRAVADNMAQAQKDLMAERRLNNRAARAGEGTKIIVDEKYNTAVDNIELTYTSENKKLEDRRQRSLAAKDWITTSAIKIKQRQLEVDKDAKIAQLDKDILEKDATPEQQVKLQKINEEHEKRLAQMLKEQQKKMDAAGGKEGEDKVMEETKKKVQELNNRKITEREAVLGKMQSYQGYTPTVGGESESEKAYDKRLKNEESRFANAQKVLKEFEERSIQVGTMFAARQIVGGVTPANFKLTKAEQDKKKMIADKNLAEALRLREFDAVTGEEIINPETTMKISEARAQVAILENVNKLLDEKLKILISTGAPLEVIKMLTDDISTNVMKGSSSFDIFATKAEIISKIINDPLRLDEWVKDPGSLSKLIDQMERLQAASEALSKTRTLNDSIIDIKRKIEANGGATAEDAIKLIDERMALRVARHRAGLDKHDKSGVKAEVEGVQTVTPTPVLTAPIIAPIVTPVTGTTTGATVAPLHPQRAAYLEYQEARDKTASAKKMYDREGKKYYSLADKEKGNKGLKKEQEAIIADLMNNFQFENVPVLETILARGGNIPEEVISRALQYAQDSAGDSVKIVNGKVVLTKPKPLHAPTNDFNAVGKMMPVVPVIGTLPGTGNANAKHVEAILRGDPATLLNKGAKLDRLVAIKQQIQSNKDNFFDYISGSGEKVRKHAESNYNKAKAAEKAAYDKWQAERLKPGASSIADASDTVKIPLPVIFKPVESTTSGVLSDVKPVETLPFPTLTGEEWAKKMRGKGGAKPITPSKLWEPFKDEINFVRQFVDPAILKTVKLSDKANHNPNSMANFGERDGVGLPEIRLSVKDREKLANFNRDKTNMTPEEIAEYKSEMVNTLAHEYYHAFYQADTTFPGTPDVKAKEMAAFSTANAITKKYTDKMGFPAFDDQSPYPVTPSFGKAQTLGIQGDRTGKGKAPVIQIPKVPELTADEQLQAEQAADLQLKIAIKKAGQIEDALIEGVKSIAQAYRKIELEYRILGKTVGTEENAKIMEGVWKSIIDNIIAAGGTEADINPQWKAKYKEAHDVLIEMAFQKQELDRLASAATSSMSAEKEVDSANIAVSAVLPGDRVGMMNAMANRDKKLRARDFNKEMVEEEKRHQAALLKARLDMTGKEEEKENQRNARFLARKKFEQEATEAGFDAQLQAATAYEERMKALRENNAVDALGKVFGLGAEQQKYMKLGASRQDRATQEMYAGAGFLVDMNKGMANAQSRNSYTNVLGGFANVGLKDYNRFGKDLNAFDFKNPKMSGNQGILGDDGKPLDWRTMDAQRFINEKLITEAIDKANESVRESKISMTTEAGVPGTTVQIGKLSIDNNIHLKFTGKAEKMLEDAGALTSTGGAFGK